MSQPRFESSDVASRARDESPWWGIHVARYLFAAPHVTDCRVLDIACGTGYGLSVLHAHARSVVGVDIDWSAAQQARACSADATVMVADGCRLPFADGSFDVVTSFETLEHLEQRGQFLSELKRILTPDGLCILSTPNANHTRPVHGKPLNPFHVFEYTPEELLAELQNYFARIELRGQVLDSRFVISPFWDDQQRLPGTLRAQTRLLIWRTFNKLPIPIGNWLSNGLWGHPLYPGATDYCFYPSAVEDAPVLVAFCRVMAES